MGQQHLEAARRSKCTKAQWARRTERRVGCPRLEAPLWALELRLAPGRVRVASAEELERRARRAERAPSARWQKLQGGGRREAVFA